MFSKQKIVASLTAIIILSPTYFMSAATVEKYEVKIFADAEKVINSDRHIKNSILSSMGSSDKDEDFKVMFIDDIDETLNLHNTSVRIRKSENDKKTEIQYKKRYAIINNDIQSAIDRAIADGFSSAEFEVEYGVSSKTLSVVKEYNFDSKLSGNTELPSLTKSYSYAKQFLPTEFSTAYSYIRIPKSVGPVKFERHEGSIENNKVKIENWEIKDMNIVELSTKVDSLEQAKIVQDSIIKKLTALGIYEPTEQLKTKIIFDNY